jgi:UDP-sugar transporter A1/2/3
MLEIEKHDVESNEEDRAPLVSAPDVVKPDRADDAPNDNNPPTKTAPPGTLTAMGLRVLILLAVQNCSKNLLLRYVMKEKPGFLTSAAVIGVEGIKLVLSTLYILFVDRRPISSIYTFLRDDHRNSMLLAIPAAAYSFQMSMEYVALANLDAAVFSVLVQTKLLATASFAVVILRRTIRKAQLISLVLLTVGVMLCNMMKTANDGEDDAITAAESFKGITATLGIALSSGFASVYTEKVIKAQRNNNVARQNYSLAYMQFQLAAVSLVILGFYASMKDFAAISKNVSIKCWKDLFGSLLFVSVIDT